MKNILFTLGFLGFFGVYSQESTYEVEVQPTYVQDVPGLPVKRTIKVTKNNAGTYTNPKYSGYVSPNPPPQAVMPTFNPALYQHLASQIASDGVRYVGDGIYQSIRVKGSLTSRKKLLKEAKERAFIFVKNQNKGVISIIKEEKIKFRPGTYPKGIITFKIISDDNSIVISFEEAKKKLIDLKEFLDLGLITKNEFDERAALLKKVLLGN